MIYGWKIGLLKFFGVFQSAPGRSNSKLMSLWSLQKITSEKYSRWHKDTQGKKYDFFYKKFWKSNFWEKILFPLEYDDLTTNVCPDFKAYKKLIITVFLLSNSID